MRWALRVLPQWRQDHQPTYTSQRITHTTLLAACKLINFSNWLYNLPAWPQAAPWVPATRLASTRARQSSLPLSSFHSSLLRLHLMFAVALAIKFICHFVWPCWPHHLHLPSYTCVCVCEYIAWCFSSCVSLVVSWTCCCQTIIFRTCS